MGAVLPFPTPYPLQDIPQDVGVLTDTLNTLINYINTIAYGNNLANTALLKALNLSDLNSPTIARTNLGLGTAATHATGDFDAAGAAAAAQAAAIAASDPVGSAAAAQAAAEAASDPAGSAAAVSAAKANKGVNSDITALTALSVVQKSANYQVAAGDQTIECDASGGAFTITYLPATAAGRVKIVKTDATYNAVNVSDGTNVLYSLVAPANGLMQTVEIYTNGAAIRVT